MPVEALSYVELSQLEEHLYPSPTRLHPALVCRQLEEHLYPSPTRLHPALVCRQGDLSLQKLWFYVQPTMRGVEILAAVANDVNKVRSQHALVVIPMADVETRGLSCGSLMCSDVTCLCGFRASASAAQC